MDSVTISPKFQIVIPKKIREQLHLKSGQKVQVVYYDKRIQLIPIPSIEEIRHSLRGMNADFSRDKSDRL